MKYHRHNRKNDQSHSKTTKRNIKTNQGSATYKDSQNRDSQNRDLLKRKS